VKSNTVVHAIWALNAGLGLMTCGRLYGMVSHCNHSEPHGDDQRVALETYSAQSLLVTFVLKSTNVFPAARFSCAEQYFFARQTKSR